MESFYCAVRTRSLHKADYIQRVNFGADRKIDSAERTGTYFHIKVKIHNTDKNVDVNLLSLWR
jgi:hypothetical protein